MSLSESVEAEAGSREVTGAIARALLSYVERSLGEGAVAAIGEETGLDLITASAEPGWWLASEDLLRMAHAAGRACGDDDIGRRAGEQLFFAGCEVGISNLITAVGSLQDATCWVVAYGTKMSTGRTLTVAEADDSRVVIEAVCHDAGLTPDSFYCSLTSGYYSLLPTLFGLVGRVVELTCQVRGDDRCRFEMTWEPDPRPVPVRTDKDRAARDDNNELMLVRFEQLQAMATELVRAEDVEDVLARVCERASLAVDAPRFLLAVETSGRQHVHQLGFRRQEDVERATATLLDGGFDDTDGVLVVEVASAQKRYGSLAAIYVPGAQFAAFERRLLEAYASHAAAALDNASLLEEIKHQALHDPLTGLPNRRLIQERASELIEATDAANASAAVLFVDLDRFKNVNDTLGHRAGDDLIGQVADRIKSALVSGQMLGRLGGDEFLVILPALERPEDAQSVAAAVVDALDAPFFLEGEELFVSCSIGVACYPAHGADLAALMRHADSAMYTAKARGRHTFAVEPSGPEPHRRQQLALETGLHKAIDNNELRVLYQPQVDLASGAVIGVEALVRWEHPTLGLLAPASFLPLAEESGLIVEMDRLVRRVAFAQGARWAAAGTALSVAVNLSTRDLQDPDLAGQLEATMASAGIDPRLVELEVTDLVVMEQTMLVPVLRELKELGVRLAIDDFGTGNSVVERLHHCPLDTLKIDKSFIDATGRDGVHVPLVRALISFAHSLELGVVAEGVEWPAQRRLLRAYGCDLGQGYLFGRPMPAEDISALLADTASFSVDPLGSRAHRSMLTSAAGVGRP